MYVNYAAAKLLQSCPTLCEPIDGSLPGSPAPGILQARTLEWVAISFSNAWKWKVNYKWVQKRGEAMKLLMHRKSLQYFLCCAVLCLVAQSCLTLCNPMDCYVPGSSVHGIFQARILKWVAISFSRVSSWPRDQTCIFCIGRRILYYWATREAHYEL